MEIQYELSCFQATSGFTNGTGVIKVKWAELNHAAITVGRKNWDDVYFHQYHSEQETGFRHHMINAFLKCDCNQLMVSEAYRTLDPSEKGAINYFVGSILTKVFAERLFKTHWLMHLDVYKKSLYRSGGLNIATVGDSNSRPDFIGIDNLGNYNVFESKGRVNFTNKVLNEAHDQSKKLKTINGSSPKLKVGCVSYHNERDLRMKIKDPEDYDENALHLKFQKGDFYYDYYASPFNYIFQNGHVLTKENGISFYSTTDKCKRFT